MDGLKPVTVGVVGVGYLGSFHAEKYQSLPGAQLLGVHDSDTQHGQRQAETLQVAFYPQLTALVDAVEALSIAVPTVHHYAIAKYCLERGRHCLLEKPITASEAEAEALIQLATRQGVVLQVGHLERFNPVLRELAPATARPQHFQALRQGPCRQRGLDVDVVLDLMIHDIDIILSLNPGPVTVLGASGAAVLGEHWDVAHAQLHFANGSSAQLSANRLADTTERWLRIYQPGSHLCLDYNAQTVTLHHHQQRNGQWQQRVNTQSGEREDLLHQQLEHFIACVRTGMPPRVDGTMALRALQVAVAIREKLGAA